MKIFSIVSTLLVILVLLLGTQADKFRAAVMATPSHGPLDAAESMTPDTLTYYCAGQAGSPLHGTVSSTQMARFFACIDQQKHRLYAK